MARSKFDLGDALILISILSFLLGFAWVYLH